MGAYTMKSGIEVCLLATKGKDAHKLVKNHNIRGLVESQREQHSKKPEEVRNRIMKLLGNISYLEMFATKKTEGWDVIGYDIDGRDIFESIKTL
jgi:site-specific DNA-methyltransferase (adenine-specific)